MVALVLMTFTFKQFTYVYMYVYMYANYVKLSEPIWWYCSVVAPKSRQHTTHSALNFLTARLDILHAEV